MEVILHLLDHCERGTTLYFLFIISTFCSFLPQVIEQSLFLLLPCWARDETWTKQVPRCIPWYVPTHGHRLFSRGGKNASKIVRPPKMALGEGILFALLGEE